MVLKMKFVFKVIGIVIFLSSNKVFGDVRSVESAIFKNILKGYDPNIPPMGKNGTGPVEVDVNFYLRQMGDIDDTKMVYDVQLTFRQEWQDKRLKYDATEGLEWITMTRERAIWVPDLFFSNEDSGRFHNILTPNVLIRILPNGNVLYSTRVSLTLSCKMDLSNYPLDNQVCQIVMASYAHTTKQLIFNWKKGLGAQISKNLMLRKFQLNGYSITDCSSSTITGNYSCLMAKFFLTRNFHTFMKHVYLPTTSLVLLCWVVFWINPKNSTIRFGIWIGALSNMYILLVSLSFKIPETSYTKAIDIWTGCCVSFIYFVGIELCFVKSTVGTVESSFTKQNKMDGDDLEEEKNSRKTGDQPIQKRLQQYCAVPLRWYNSSPKEQVIDVIFRVIYPLAFAIFAFFYWIIHSVSVEQDLCEGGGHCYSFVKN